jgi:hypothetical protein
MPTVKLQNGKVILKGGKVSCSCCAVEPDCCMYPADGLGDTYEAADLPDEVALTYDFAEGTIMTRDGEQYTEEEFGIYRINRIADGTDDCGESGPKWRLQIKDGEGNWFTDNCTDCLIVPGFVEDQFADCYEVDFDGVGVIVTRISLCRWEGFSGSGIASVFFLQNEQKWATSIETGSGQQSGFKSNQSSPEGTYDQDISDPFAPAVIVTEIECP